MTDLNQLSILEVAEKLLHESKEPMSFIELFQAISEAKGLSDEQRNEIISQVYADFIISAKFVYVGDDLWDLKSRQSIDLWDKDGAYYDEFPDYAEELEELESEEEYEEEEELDEEEDEEELDEDEEEEEVYEDDLDYDDFDEDEEDYIEDESDIVPDVEDDFDDEKYNEYMDDYEKMYDE
ncbi:MAG: DNA-directed RNA polymerase subunit delta [Bacilli bacterium]|nr:DNA-directed RNA polymerase subunit delta [Bacilli bacterium]